MDDLLSELFKKASPNKNFYFFVVYAISSEWSRQEKINKAKECERQGYIKLSRSDTGDTVGNGDDVIVGVTLEGVFTEKGIDYMKKKQD